MRVIKSGFYKSIMALVGGTAFAQLISILVLPLLTRLYGAGHFGDLAIFVSLLSIVGAVICLRLEMVIALPARDSEAANVTVLSLVVCFLLSLLVFGVLALLPGELLEQIGIGFLVDKVWLLALGLFLFGSYSTFQYWFGRFGKFAVVAKTRVTQIVLGSVVQLGAGLYGLVSGGLILGQVLSSGGGAFLMAGVTLVERKRKFRSVIFRSLLRTLRKYRRIMAYSSLEAVSNAGSIHLPVLLIGYLGAGKEAGFLLIASKILGAPMQLIGSSISQVYLANAPKELREGRLYPFTVHLIRRLAIGGVPLLVAVAIFSPFVFELVFGEGWGRAGVLLQWMVPWFAFQLLSSPVSTVLYVVNKHKVAMQLQVFGVIFRVGSVYTGYLLGGGQVVAEAYAISGGVFYAIYFLVVLLIVRQMRAGVAHGMRLGASNE